MPNDHMQAMTTFANLSSRNEISNYVEQISNDFNSTKRHQEQSPNANTDKGSLITLNFVNYGMQEKEGGSLLLEVSSSATIKSVFSDYAEKRGGVSLRSFRFTLNDKNLFLSQISKSTPAELGWKNQDIIRVHAKEPSMARTPKESGSLGQKSSDTKSSQAKAKRNNRKPNTDKRCHGGNSAKPDQIKIEKKLEEWKIEVSCTQFLV